MLEETWIWRKSGKFGAQDVCQHVCKWVGACAGSRLHIVSCYTPTRAAKQRGQGSFIPGT